MLARSMIGVALLAAFIEGGVQPAELATEFERLSRDLVTSVSAADRAGLASRLDRGRAALAAGDAYLALYDLQTVFEGEAGYRLSATQAQITTAGDFKGLWTKLGSPAAQRSSRAAVLFIEALAQSSEGRADATYRASLPYAQDAGVAAGLYYLGESHAMVTFARHCRALALPSPGPWPTLVPLEPVLSTYESEVVKAYDGAAAPVRPRFAAVNVAIKIARTLNDAGQHEGAALQYLVSRHRYRLLKAQERAAPSVTELKDRLHAVKRPAAGDHSILEFFLQLASASLRGTEPVPHSAAVILDDIVPAYLELVAK